MRNGIGFSFQCPGDTSRRRRHNVAAISARRVGRVQVLRDEPEEDAVDPGAVAQVRLRRTPSRIQPARSA